MIFSKRSLKPFYVVCCMSNAVFGMNCTRPYDWFLQQSLQGDKNWQLSVLAEKGFTAKGFNEDGCKVDVLRILECEQNAIAMLKGFSDTCEASKLLAKLALTSDDDGFRGRFNVSGCLESRYAFGLGLQRALPMDFSVGMYLPMYSMRLSNVRWCDKTKNLTADDKRVHDNLTDNIVENVKRLGCLNICGWERSGLGDLGIFLEWLRDFEQSKPILKNVRLQLRAGTTLPTGLRVNEDRIFALPFGNDGAVGLLFGGRFAATMGEHLKLGFTVELQHLFGSTRLRRIKTYADQTSHLLLAKTCAYKETDLSQEFNLFAELYHTQELSLRFSYQFVRHGESRLSLITHDFSTETADTARQNEEWTMHNGIVSLCYNGVERFEDSRVIPVATFYVKAPFNGKCVALAPAIGMQLRLNF
jgi:hypothetical protein